MRHARPTLLILAGMALLVIGLAAPATAQVPPLPTTTTTAPPDGDDPDDGRDDPDDGGDGEVSPVFELLGPIAWPACEDAVAVMLTLPEIPSITTDDGPVFVLCGMVTEPDGRYTCSVDKTGQDLIVDAVADLLGIEPPVTPEPTAMVYGTVLEVVDQTQPPEVLPVDPVSTAGSALGCVPMNSDDDLNPVPPPPPRPSFPGPPSPSAPTTPTPTFTAPSGGFTPPPARAVGAPLVVQVDPELAAPVDPQGATMTAAAARTFLRGPNFAYPVVFAIPLLLLALGGYLGSVLSRPVPIVVPTSRSSS